MKKYSGSINTQHILMRCSLRLLISLLYFLMVFSSAAQETYQATEWQIKDGLIANSCNSILKDNYGFIWFATQHQGLSRFDGKKFMNYNQPCGLGLIEDSLHNMWIGSANQLSRFNIKEDSFSVVFKPIPGVSDNNFIIPFWANREEVFCIEKNTQITSYNIHTLKKRIVLNEFLLKQGANGEDYFRFHFSILDPLGNSVWMLNRGGLTEIIFSSGKQVYYPLTCRNNNSTENHDAPGMCYDKKRNVIWLNTTEGLVQFDVVKKQFILIAALNNLLSKKNYEVYPGISIDTKQRIWFATGPANGILIYDPADQSIIPAFTDPDIQQKVAEDNMCLYCDRESTTWAGKWSRKGVYQVSPFSKTVSRFVSAKTSLYSISNNAVNSLANGPAGKLWVGTTDGLNIFNPLTSVFKTLRKNNLNGINSNDIKILAIDTVTRKAWIACAPPYRFFEIDLNTMKCRNIILKDTAGQVMQLSDFENISSANYNNGCIISVRGKGIFLINGNSLMAKEIIRYSTEFVTKIVTGDDRFVFLKLYGSTNSRTYKVEQDTWKLFPTVIDSSKWLCIYYDNYDHSYWVGEQGKPVQYNKNFKPISSSVEKPAPGEKGILGILKDNDGNIWFNKDDGEISKLNLKTGKLINLEEKDGYTRQLFEFDNPCIKDAFGNLYFAGDDGLDRISPAKLTNDFPPSHVYLNSIEINGNKFLSETATNGLKQLSLQYFQNRVSVETGNIDFYSKGNGRIRYKLKESNDEWQYGSDYYTIRYEGLTPGKHTLIMQASNVVDDFNGPEKILVIDVSPPFWDTWWFRAITLIVLSLLLYGIYRWRTATLRKQKRILEQTVKERTAEVVEEKIEVEKQKAKSDELLLNILPFEVAEELKEKGYTTAKSFDEVTVLFSDIKGFTHVAEKLTAQQLVKEIDTYFSAFDRIMQQYGLEKIKTIGDAYIAVGGLPDDNAATAQKVVEAAIAMQHVVDNFKQERIENNLPHFELRIGIHTGPVVAGVVGIKKFQYDIWGDTVNMAARMEQSGEPGKINISQYTYEIIRNDFNCTPRGKIEAKNKGEIDMYFVEQPK